MKIVPQVKGLTVPEILEFAKSKWDIFDYLPEHSDCRLPNRVFLWNVVNSLIPEEFDYFVKENLADRERRRWLIKEDWLSLFFHNLSRYSKNLRTFRVSMLILHPFYKRKWKKSLSLKKNNSSRCKTKINETKNDRI